jgi:hypothetical protein
MTSQVSRPSLYYLEDITSHLIPSKKISDNITSTATKCNAPCRPFSPPLSSNIATDHLYKIFKKSDHQLQGGPDTGLVFKWLVLRLAVLTAKNAWQFNYSVIFVQYNELFMNRSVGELYNIVTSLSCFKNVRDLVKFVKLFFWKIALS